MLPVGAPSTESRISGGGLGGGDGGGGVGGSDGGGAGGGEGGGAMPSHTTALGWLQVRCRHAPLRPVVCDVTMSPLDLAMWMSMHSLVAPPLGSLAPQAANAASSFEFAVGIGTCAIPPSGSQ